MNTPPCRTRIVCTIGPACDAVGTLEKMVGAGMNVARLNFSHGDFEWHGQIIEHIRKISAAAGRPIAIMADLPGPKIRIGRITGEPVTLKKGDEFTLTGESVSGDAHRVTVDFPGLPDVLKAGDAVFLNDGLIELEVEETTAGGIRCRVLAGGELRSRGGLNLPGVNLGIEAFTDRDRRCLEFALEAGVDAVSQSFVVGAKDIRAVREAAAARGHHPFIVAKIERAPALERFDEILAAADGIMIARGDLGVEVPIERIAVVQKDLIARAVERKKPVITATQMLESMTVNRRPTRAEATDVANAVFDGTDAVMLSGETAAGSYPLESVEMLVRIASYAERHGPASGTSDAPVPSGGTSPVDLVAASVRQALHGAGAAAVFVPTVSGATARRIARFRPAVWIVAVTPSAETYRHLLFSRGVVAVHEPRYPGDWNDWIRRWTSSRGLEGTVAILAEGPSPRNPDANHRMEIIEL